MTGVGPPPSGKAVKKGFLQENRCANKTFSREKFAPNCCKLAAQKNHRSSPQAVQAYRSTSAESSVFGSSDSSGHTTTFPHKSTKPCVGTACLIFNPSGSVYSLIREEPRLNSRHPGTNPSTALRAVSPQRTFTSSASPCRIDTMTLRPQSITAHRCGRA